MVTSQYVAAKQAGNGVIVAFNFSFKILATTDLVVSKLNAAGISSGTLILGTDYTVTFDAVAETGTVTYTVAPVSGGFSVIARSSDTTQQTSLPREGNAPAKTTETMIDKAMMISQEIIGASVESFVELSGPYASRPTAPSIACYYASLDRGSYEKWVPALSRWILIG